MSATRRKHVSREAFGRSPERWEDALQALKTAGLKSSRIRAAIIEAFFAVGEHVTPEELAARVRERTGPVSVSTVYRTFKVLVEHGLASAHQFGKGQARFEPALQRRHHDHLVCTRCRNVVEFVESRIEELQTAAARSHGFEIHSHKLEIYGVCPRCRGVSDIEAPRAKREVDAEISRRT